MQYPRVTGRIVLSMLMLAGQHARAGKDCDAPPETWQPRGAVNAVAERNGWRVERLKVDDGCYEIKGRDAEGRRLKAKIDPASLKVISVRREHGERDRDRHRDRPGELLPMAPPAPVPASAPTGGLAPTSISSFG
jgi:hypothetical protein